MIDQRQVSLVTLSGEQMGIWATIASAAAAVGKWAVDATGRAIKGAQNKKKKQAAAKAGAKRQAEAQALIAAQQKQQQQTIMLAGAGILAVTLLPKLIGGKK